MALKYWLLLSRIPFLSVMILPYILGALLASKLSGDFSWLVFLFGLCGSILIQLASHYSGEVYDVHEDRLSISLEKNFFSGGSQVLVENHVAPKNVKILIAVVIFFALIIGLILQFYFKTGRLTLFLGISGVIGGLFYSMPPLRWVSRGLGELLIAYAFGWLAVNAGFYIQASRFDILATLVSFPVSCAVVNIILINEYPDYPADKLAAKQNLLVRIGKEKGAFLYTGLAVISVLTFTLSLAKGLPFISGIFYLPVLIMAIILASQMLKKAYNNRQSLEKMCALTILVSLGTSLSMVLGLLIR